MYFNTIRYFSLSNVFSKSAAGKFMNKIMKSTGNKSRKWTPDNSYAQPAIFTANSVAKGAPGGHRAPSSTRRQAVLNKLFMRYITDLMATGDSASEFLGRGIEINRVMVTPDFKGVNVFWIAKGTESDEDLEHLFTKNAGALRHELSSLRVMGVVPKINFIKDKQFAKLMEVDLRLAKADFGEDHVPIEPSYLFKSVLSVKETIPQHIKEKIRVMESEEVEDIEDLPLPPMRNDILGLNHSVMMHKIQQLKKKSQALHRRADKSTEENKLSCTFNEDPVQFESQKKQNEAFQKFLLRRQILKAKASRLKDKSYPEYEYFREPKSKILEDCPFADELLDAEKDYLEETEDNKI